MTAILDVLLRALIQRAFTGKPRTLQPQLLQ